MKLAGGSGCWVGEEFEGEKMGGGFDQNILYTCMKFSNNKKTFLGKGKEANL